MALCVALLRMFDIGLVNACRPKVTSRIGPTSTLGFYLNPFSLR
jgi:hypothetical protein